MRDAHLASVAHLAGRQLAPSTVAGNGIRAHGARQSRFQQHADGRGFHAVELACNAPFPFREESAQVGIAVRNGALAQPDALRLAHGYARFRRIGTTLAGAGSSSRTTCSPQASMAARASSTNPSRR